MMLRYTFDASRRAMPPSLTEQKPLIDPVERPFLPRLSREPLVLREGFAAMRTARIDASGSAIFEIAGPLACSQFGKRKVFVGRKNDVLEPIDIGLRQRRRRNAEGEASQGRM